MHPARRGIALKCRTEWMELHFDVIGLGNERDGREMEMERENVK